MFSSLCKRVLERLLFEEFVYLLKNNIMKIILTLCTLALMLLTKTDENRVDIHFTKNIEFFGYIVELGDPSNNDPDHPISKVIHMYPDNSSNDKLAEIFSLAGKMDYSTIVNMMYFLPDFPLDPDYVFPLDQATVLGFESQDEMNTLQELVSTVNGFYIDSDFDTIWSALEPYRKEALGVLNEMRPPTIFMETIESFYGSTFNSYEIVPSLTIWSGPGWGLTDSNRDKATFVLGPLRKNYVFDDTNFESLAIHEFGHSFVNGIVLKNTDVLDQTKSLFTTIQPEMVPQGYSNWNTCMIEHFVRAGEIIVMAQLGDHKKSKALLEDYKVNRNFIYLEFIVEKLNDYRLKRKLDYRESVSLVLSDLEKKFMK